MKTHNLKCPECGSRMELRVSRYGLFWGCERWPDCDGTHGAHPDGTPLGRPADKATKKARIEAHTHFDAWWKSKGLTRKQGYKALRHLMGLSRKEAHIGKFTETQCNQLISRLKGEHCTTRRTA